MTTLTIDGKNYTWGDRLGYREAMEIERLFDAPVSEWETAMEAGQLRAIGIMVYIVQRREDPTLDFDTFDFDVMSVEVKRQPAPSTGPRPRVRKDAKT